MAASATLPPAGGRALPSRSKKPLLAAALAVPAIYIAFAANKRRQGVIEGKKADKTRDASKAYLESSKTFEGHPPVERSGGDHEILQISVQFTGYKAGQQRTQKAYSF